MNLSPIALKILEARYLRKDEEGKVIETPEELFERVAAAISSVEEKYNRKAAEIENVRKKFLEILKSFDFLPNSPCLMNAGTPLGQLAACFVLPIEDSMESIFETLKHAAIIHKTGGGTGFSFSRLRPKGDIVRSTKGVSSGPVSFLRVYDAATEEIKQGGRRRGANMGVLLCHHPDIEEFINLKREPGVITNFNISVAVTDTFMEALEKDTFVELVNPRNNEVVKKAEASWLFGLMCENAWRTGDPGAIFIDTINRFNPVPGLGNIEATNPCGEQPLLAYESCVLGSINISNFVNEDGVDWERLKETIYTSVRFLDDMIDANVYPIPQIKEMTLKTRKIGLGIMGLADAFIKLKLRYGGRESLRFAERVMAFIQYNSKKASVELAKERGAFPAISESVYANKERLRNFLQMDTALSDFDWEALVEEVIKYGIRNATTTTVAPTGSISLIAGCSSGIEPLFALSYTRKALDDEVFTYVHPLLERAFEEYNVPADVREKAISVGKLSDISGVPDEMKDIFITTYDIPFEEHIMMQATIQKYTDNAVSKTINLPYSATVEEIKKAYLLAYEKGCKGITVFRDRCRMDQVITAGTGREALRPRKRPRVTLGATIKMRTGCGNLYVTINEDEQGLFEVFSQLGKTGGCAASQLEAISRLISLALRSGIDVVSILKQIAGIRCPNPSWDNGRHLLSCADAIAKAIEEYLELKGLKVQLDEEGVAGICPECGNILRASEGCTVCEICGFSKC